MKIAMVVQPLEEEKLKVAAQIGVEEIVGRCPGFELADLQDLKETVEKAGLRLGVIEGRLPLPPIVLAKPDRDEAIEKICRLIRNMGELGVSILCYNFMAPGDMTRTSFEVQSRGGAWVSAFDSSRLDDTPAPEAPLKEETIWERLEYFLQKIVPAAEAAGVKLAMHPDDPPIPAMNGIARIMGRVDNFLRLVELVPSEANGICLCMGCFSEMGEEIPAVVEKIGPHIHYAHFRNVQGCVPQFQEAFHDCGQIQMPAAIRALRDIGFEGPIRPDHVPRLEGESGRAHGYTFQGRLFAVGYLRGVMQSVYSE